MSKFLAALARARKALAPLILGAVAVPVQWIADGNFDLGAFRTALAGLVTALIVYWVRNEPQTGTAVTIGKP
jgi:uncharacterized membrane protein YeaQ/YmgE (transglycosylase-associated protein family)